MTTTNESNPLTESGQTVLPTEFGTFLVSAFGFEPNKNHLILVYGKINQGDSPLVRIHSECITSEVFGSLKCDCKSQLLESIDLIKSAGSGIIIYLRQEGRGIGLFNKIEAYRLQELGHNTISANLELELPVDTRDYELAYRILRSRGINSIRLITNNDDKVDQMKRYGLGIKEIIHTNKHYNTVNNEYIDTKITHMGHKYLNHDKTSIPY